MLLISIVSYFIYCDIELNKRKEYEQQQEQLKEKITLHYNKYVITTEETKLYKKENNKYIENGKINKGVFLTLADTKIDANTKYFYIEDLDSYISYKNIKPSEEYSKSDRYKKYIYFNKNIKTNNTTSFYDKNKNYLYTLNNSFEFPVLIMDNEYYGIVFKEELLYIKKKDVNSIYDNINTDLKNKSRIMTFTYHFIYDPATTKCNQVICHSLNQFETHLQYLSENNFLTLTMKELELYLDSKLKIPENSVVLTIDDGTVFDLKTLDLLEKYKINATMFVITGWGIDFNKYKSDYLDLESHTNDMHTPYVCGNMGNQGGGILCLDEEFILNDLKQSKEALGESNYFAYPFFDFNNKAIELLKKSGFHLAFIGQYDTEGFSYPNKTDKYKLRRYTIFSNTSLAEYKNHLH